MSRKSKVHSQQKKSNTEEGDKKYNILNLFNRIIS